MNQISFLLFIWEYDVGILYNLLTSRLVFIEREHKKWVPPEYNPVGIAEDNSALD